MRISPIGVCSLLAIVLFCFSLSSLAHVEGGTGTGLIDGFLHPIMGFDHVVAMFAVGLWGAFLGKPAIWMRQPHECLCG